MRTMALPALGKIVGHALVGHARRGNAVRVGERGIEVDAVRRLRQVLADDGDGDGAVEAPGVGPPVLAAPGPRSPTGPTRLAAVGRLFEGATLPQAGVSPTGFAGLWKQEFRGPIKIA